MIKILVVDDEPKIREMITKFAIHEGFKVVEATDGKQAVDIFQTETFQLVIMDIMMPNLDGFSACEQIKKISDVPVIMLSAKGEEYDKVHGFEIGVDDYVVKPFSPKELMMRINAVIKRTYHQNDIFTINGLSVDFNAHIVTVDGVNKSLSPKEYDLLVYLIQNQGKVISREQILKKIWSFDYFGDDRTLDTHIKLLRKNLGPYSNLIVTLRGVGYRFEKSI